MVGGGVLMYVIEHVCLSAVCVEMCRSEYAIVYVCDTCLYDLNWCEAVSLLF